MINSLKIFRTVVKRTCSRRDFLPCVSAWLFLVTLPAPKDTALSAADAIDYLSGLVTLKFIAAPD